MKSLQCILYYEQNLKKIKSTHQKVKILNLSKWNPVAHPVRFVCVSEWRRIFICTVRRKKRVYDRRRNVKNMSHQSPNRSRRTSCVLLLCVVVFSGDTVHLLHKEDNPNFQTPSLYFGAVNRLCIGGGNIFGGKSF